jgi:alpha-D-xyloside xylohydrolase
MMDQLNSYGMKVMVSVWPHVTEQSENFIPMKTMGLLTHDANGSLIAGNGNHYISDEFNPATREFIWDKVKRHYYDYGIKTYWLDADEPERSRPGLQWWYDRHDAEIAMVWVREHHRTFYDGLKEQGEQEFIMLSRQTWIGSHTLNAAVWSGDISSTFEELLK